MYNLIYNNHRITFGNVNVGYEYPYATITYSTVEHGTLTGVDTALIGSIITVTAIPSTGYSLSYITVNGTQIEGNSFVVTENTTVGAVFTGILRSVTTTSSPVAGGSVTASPNSGIIGTEVTLSNTPNTGYNFDKYTIVSGTGASISGNTLTIGTSNVTVRGDFLAQDPYNPLNLPANTVRVRTSNGSAPTKGSETRYETATLVAGTTDVYDVYKSGTNFRYLLRSSSNVVEVLGANTTGITNMLAMFSSCTSLTTVALFDTSSVTNMIAMFQDCESMTTVPLFDTSSVTNMNGMFQECSSLTSVPLFNTSSATNMNAMFQLCSSLTTVPLFNTSKVTDMDAMFYNDTKLTSVPLFNTSKVADMAYMFYNCYKVESGAYALYQQASTQTTPPTYHTNTFKNCGRDTTTGAAELAQIPSDWK